MKKLGSVAAALATIALAAPSIASAETVVIKRGGHHHHWDRGYHRGWHHGWHRDWHHSRDRVVIRHRDY